MGRRPLGGRVERWRRGRARVPDAPARRRQRPGRVAPQPGRLERRRRPAADARRRPLVAVRLAVAAVLGRRADGTHGRRRRPAARGDGRARRAGPLSQRTAPSTWPGRSTPTCAAAAWRGARRSAACRSSRPCSRRPSRRRGRLADLGMDVAEDEPDLAGRRRRCSRPGGRSLRALAGRALRQRRRADEGDRALERRARPRAHRRPTSSPPTRLHAELGERVARVLRPLRLPGLPGRRRSSRSRSRSSTRPRSPAWRWAPTSSGCARARASPSPAARRSRCPPGCTAAGLPAGLQLVARPFAERALLEAAHALDGLTGYSRLVPPAAVADR